MMRAWLIVVVLTVMSCGLGRELHAEPACLSAAASRRGFELARARFCDHAQKTLKLPIAQILVSPIEAAPSVQPPERTGAAWAFYGTSRATPANQVRGWALADGTVITLERNLGLLLQEAGVWSPQRPLTASQLAELLVWSLGMNHRVVGRSELEVAQDGTGMLRFRAAYRPPGPSHGLDRITQFTISLTADRHAHVDTREVPPPAEAIIE